MFYLKDAIKSGFGLSVKAKEVFAAADTDGSQEIDADEFHVYMRGALHVVAPGQPVAPAEAPATVRRGRPPEPLDPPSTHCLPGF
eukprot:SAG11_NODE_18574_length_487_cov_0.670103_1_plen_85_part_00